MPTREIATKIEKTFLVCGRVWAGFLNVPISAASVATRAYSKRVFALIVHSELKSVHPGFPVAFIFFSTS